MSARQSGRRISMEPESLKDELESKSLQLMSVQRNYESISRMMQMKQKEIDELRLKLDVEMGTRVSFGLKVEELEGRLAVADKRSKDLSDLPRQLSELQTECETRRRESAMARAKFDGMLERLNGMSKELDAAQSAASSSRREAEDARKAARRAEAEVEDRKSEVRALSSEMRALRDNLSKCQGECAAAHQAAQAAAGKLTRLEEDLSTAREASKQLQRELAAERSSRATMNVSLKAAHGATEAAEAALHTSQRALENSHMATAAAEARLQETERQLEACKASIASREQEILRLRGALSDAEECAQSLVSQGVMTDEVVTDLHRQLAMSRAQAAAELEAQKVAMAEVHQELASALEECERARDEARHLQSASTQQRHLHRDFISVVSRRMGALEARLGEMGASMLSNMSTASTNLERLGSSLELRLGGWEEELAEVGSTLGLMGPLMDELRRQADERLAKQSPKGRNLKDVDAELSNMKSRWAEVQSQLSSALEARDLAEQALSRARSQHRTALEAAEASAAAALRAEEARAARQLGELESEVARLRAAVEESSSSSALMVEEERRAAEMAKEALIRELNEVKKELAGAREEGNKRLTLLSNRMLDEMEKLKEAHKQRIEELTSQQEAMAANARDVANRSSSAASAEAGTLRDVIACSWRTLSDLLNDMVVVARHLAKMGVDVQGCEPDEALMKSAAEQVAVSLHPALTLARLHFSYITEAVQGMVKKQPNWAAVERELRGTVAKLIAVEESQGSCLTCMVCLNIFNNPVTAVPCGHTFCQECLTQRSKNICTECTGRVVEVWVHNNPVDVLCSKYDYKLTALKSVQKAIQGGSSTEKKSTN